MWKEELAVKIAPTGSHDADFSPAAPSVTVFGLSALAYGTHGAVGRSEGVGVPSEEFIQSR